ncbi:MAG: fatty acid desaturase [Chloroflexota bacterium]
MMERIKLSTTLSDVESPHYHLPSLSDLGEDLLVITPFQCVMTLMMPFVCVGLYILLASLGVWPIAVAVLVYLSFITYGSTSHDLVHRNLGLSRSINDFFLSFIELMMLRSGHAYRLAHFHHHARFPHDDDIEGAAAKHTFWYTFIDGMTLQFRIYVWAIQKTKHYRRYIVLEGIGCFSIIVLAIALLPMTAIPLVYVLLISLGSWFIPLITSYIPHDPRGKHPIEQTRLFRGKIVSVIALEHLYHLEHHLYPAVPHHNWPRLAKRLDPYFEQYGIKPMKLWF